jgi:hypothetical protein
VRARNEKLYKKQREQGKKKCAEPRKEAVAPVSRIT